MACLECSNDFMKNAILYDLIYAIQFLNVKSINMLIQKWKNDRNLLLIFSRMVKLYLFQKDITYSIVFVNKMQYFEFSS